MKSFGLYWHFILDIILTHVYVIAFLHAGVSIAAALSMSLDSLLRIILLVPLSRIFTQYRSSLRYKISVFLRFLLVGIWFFSIKQFQHNAIMIYALLPYIIFKLLFLIDSTLSADLIFAAHERYHIDLTKSAAAQNIFSRASTAFAPAVALILLNTSNASLAAFLFVIAMGVLSVFSLRSIIFDSEDLVLPQKNGDILTFSRLISNPLMYWGFAFQFIGNLSFAGVAFLLLSFLKLHGDIFVNEITALYAAFLISQSVVLVRGDGIIPLNKTIQVAFVMGVCGVLIILTSLTHLVTVRLILCSGVGLTYSLLLSGVQKVVTARLKGPGFLSYAAWSQTISRFTSFIITGLLGVAMHYGYPSSMLLMISGVFGVIGALILGYIPIAIEKSKSGVQT